MNNYDIAIIGSGVAGAFAALRLSEKHPDQKVILFDIGKIFFKRRRFLEGFLGCFPNGDGKLYTNNIDSVSELTGIKKAKSSYNYVSSYLSQVNNMKLIKDTLPQSAFQKKVKELNFDIKTNDHYQWKPDSIHALTKIISEKLENWNNMTFSFDNEVYKIIKKRGQFLISSESGDVSAKKVILCVGRSGWRWATELYKDLGITVEDDYARIGIRCELSGSNAKELNKTHCTLIRDDLELGPFNWNGTVIPEDHADMVISTFRSNEERWKSEKVSFSLISPKLYKGQGVAQSERLAKLTFLLFNDRVTKERVKMVMKNESQLSILPEFNWLPKTLELVESFMPNIISKGYFHIPEISPIPAKIDVSKELETEVEGLFVAGECAGVRGILSAAVMGCIAADNASK
jgi:hypothetical protein